MELAFLKHGRALDSDATDLRRRKFVLLVGTDRFPTLKSLSDELGYADPSRVSHLKSGHRHISAALARGMESKLGLALGYFDRVQS